MSNEFQRARRLSPEEVNAVTLSSAMNVVVGADEVVLVRPAGTKVLWVGAHSIANFALRPGDYRARTFDDADVTVGTDVVVMDTEFGGVHEFEAGDGPYQLTTSGVLPAGLALATDYYVEVVSTTEVAFHLSREAAIAAATATRVDITAAAGGGTHTIAGLINVVAAATVQDGSVRGFVFDVGGADDATRMIPFSAADRTTMSVVATGVVYYWFS